MSDYTKIENGDMVILTIDNVVSDFIAEVKQDENGRNIIHLKAFKKSAKILNVKVEIFKEATRIPVK